MEVPEIPQEMKEHLKAERLAQYQTRIFQTQMDIVALESVNDVKRLEVSKTQLNALINAYDAISVM